MISLLATKVDWVAPTKEGIGDLLCHEMTVVIILQNDVIAIIPDGICLIFNRLHSPAEYIKLLSEVLLKLLHEPEPKRNESLPKKQKRQPELKQNRLQPKKQRRPLD